MPLTNTSRQGIWKTFLEDGYTELATSRQEPRQSTFKNVPENYAKLKELPEAKEKKAAATLFPFLGFLSIQVTEAYYCDNSCAEGLCPKCWLDKGTRPPASGLVNLWNASLPCCRCPAGACFLKKPCSRQTCLSGPAQPHYDTAKNKSTCIHACTHVLTYLHQTLILRGQISL